MVVRFKKTNFVIRAQKIQAKHLVFMLLLVVKILQAFKLTHGLNVMFKLLFQYVGTLKLSDFV